MLMLRFNTDHKMKKRIILYTLGLCLSGSMLSCSNLLDLDLSSHKDKSQFQATQKVLSIVFTVFEASVLVASLRPL